MWVTERKAQKRSQQNVCEVCVMCLGVSESPDENRKMTKNSPTLNQIIISETFEPRQFQELTAPRLIFFLHSSFFFQWRNRPISSSFTLGSLSAPFAYTFALDTHRAMPVVVVCIVESKAAAQFTFIFLSLFVSLRGAFLWIFKYFFLLFRYVSKLILLTIKFHFHFLFLTFGEFLEALI